MNIFEPFDPFASPKPHEPHQPTDSRDGINYLKDKRKREAREQAELDGVPTPDSSEFDTPDITYKYERAFERQAQDQINKQYLREWGLKNPSPTGPVSAFLSPDKPIRNVVTKSQKPRVTKKKTNAKVESKKKSKKSSYKINFILQKFR